MDKMLWSPLAEHSPFLLSLLGILVVFVGLVAIIGIVFLMNTLCELFEKRSKKEQSATVAPTSTPALQPRGEEPVANRQEILAAVCAAVAEENGTDISAIRVISFKKLEF